MAWLLERLRAHRPDLVVLARYMQIVTPELVDAVPQPHHQHPPVAAAVPPGRQRLQAGVRGGRAGVSGCTAHFVTEQLDQGPVILQDVFHIRVGEDTLDEVKTRGQELEGKVLSQAVQLFTDEQLVVKDKKVIFRPGHITAS